VWPKGDKPPILFMGLLDTVGAYGLPRIDALAAKPLTYQYRPFRDFVVSGEVQHVFQACSTHDRLTPFEPCCVRRKEDYRSSPTVGTPQARSGASAGGDDTVPGRDQPDGASHKYNVEYTTEEWWYPGGSGIAADFISAAAGCCRSGVKGYRCSTLLQGTAGTTNMCFACQ
jgi:hypothetical protein